ncbi:uncharacterized protein LOC144627560 [Crassostrea virginica]
MFVKAKRYCFAATLFAFFWRRVHGSYNQSYKHNGSANCGFNYYFNGNYCAECPTGTYGVNCSNLCQPLTYGKFCSEICNCTSSICHHVYGCNLVSTVLSRKTTMFETLTGTTNTNSDITTERDIDKKNMSATTGFSYRSTSKRF